MSDTVWLALIAMVGSSVALWLRMKSMSRDAKDDAAKKDQALREIHILVNGNTKELLEQIKTLTQAIADASPMDLVKAQAALVADGAVERKEAAIESLNAYPTATEPDRPKAS